MLRYTFIVMAVLGTAATAIAAVQPSSHFATLAEPAIASAHVTVISKNSPFPVVGPIVVEQCAVEDCSDTNS
jgi:hypothetical protein